MLGTLVFLATSLTYNFPVGVPIDYQVDVKFDGFIQMFGGKDADVTVHMQVEATGKEADTDHNPQVVSEIKDMHVFLKEQEFPFTTSSITRFFPKTTVSLSPLGTVLKNDAPTRKLPVRLPGLDATRFPEITYLPLEFPAEGVELNKPWTFKKPFGDSQVEYTVTPSAIDDDKATLSIQVKQSYTQFEDKYGNVVEEKDAAVKVPTTVEGAGSATFNRKRGIVSGLHIEAKATSTATDIATGTATPRKLNTVLDIVAK